MKRFIKLLLCVMLGLSMTTSCKDKDKPDINDPKHHVEEPFGKAVVILSDELTESEVRAVNKAIKVWNDTANGNFVFEIVSGDWESIDPYYNTRMSNGRCYDVIGIDSVIPLHPKIEKLDAKHNAKVRGYATRNECSHTPVAFVPFRIDNEHELVWVIMHELGHAIGLPHLIPQSALMYNGYNEHSTCTEKTCCITKPDVKKLCSDLGCDVELTAYCSF